MELCDANHFQELPYSHISEMPHLIKSVLVVIIENVFSFSNT